MTKKKTTKEPRWLKMWALKAMLVSPNGETHLDISTSLPNDVAERLIKEIFHSWDPEK